MPRGKKSPVKRKSRKTSPRRKVSPKRRVRKTSPRRKVSPKRVKRKTSKKRGRLNPPARMDRMDRMDRIDRGNRGDRAGRGGRGENLYTGNVGDITFAEIIREFIDNGQGFCGLRNSRIRICKRIIGALYNYRPSVYDPRNRQQLRDIILYARAYPASLGFNPEQVRSCFICYYRSYRVLAMRRGLPVDADVDINFMASGNDADMDFMGVDQV